MELTQVFDTLIYGKGTAKRGKYHFITSVKSNGSYTDLGYKKTEDKVSTYYVTYKGETVLVIEQVKKGYRFHTSVLYDGRNRHNFNKNINKTLTKIIDYHVMPYSEYKAIY